MDKYDSLQDVLRYLGDADGWDLCARLSALQLMPANARFRVRLEAAIHAAASLPVGGDRFKMSHGRFKSLLSSSELTQTFAWMEDPIENLFCGPVLFFGGEYLVPFDQSPSQSYAFEAIANVLARRPEGIPDHVREECLGLIAAAAALGDRAMRLAGVSRYAAEESLDLDGPIFPPAGQGADLAAACSFTLDELSEICMKRGLPRPVLAPLVSAFADQGLAVFDSEGGPLYSRPILNRGDEYMIALPAALCSAACHQVIALCQDNACRERLVTALAEYTWDRVCGSASDLGLLLDEEVKPHGNACMGEFEVDSDRTVVIRVAVDPFDDHDPEVLVGSFGSASEQFNTLVKEVGRLRAAGRETAGLLLLLTTTNGYMIGVLDDDSTRMCSTMSADLFTMFSALEAGHPARLWYYLRDRELLSEQSQVIATDERDILGIYRDNDHSFYLSDGARPNAVNFVVGSGLVLLREWAERFDEHVRAVPRMGYGWVTCRWEKSSLPVYVPKRMPPGLALVELPRCDLWIAVNCESPSLTQQLADAVSYWFARLAADGQRLDTPAGAHVLVLDTSGLEARFESGSITSSSARPTMVTGRQTTRIVIADGVPPLFAPNDSTGELALVALCLEAVAPSGYAASVAYLEMAATRSCRMIQGIDIRREIAADPRGLEPPVFIEPSQTSAVLDLAGRLLSERISSRTLAPVELLNAMVVVLYELLTAALSQLSALDRIVWLVGCNESLSAESELSRLTLEGRRSCFGQFGEMEDALAKEREERDTASIACRFLVELAGCLPSGDRKSLTRATYDELLALSAQVVGFGIESDLLHFEIAEFEVSMLQSGRLGRAGGDYQDAVSQYARATMERSPDNFADSRRLEMPQRLREAEQAALQAVMNALPAELRLTIEDLGSALDVLCEIGDRTETGIVAMSRAEVRERLVTSTGEAAADELLELLVLHSREGFLRPPPPHSPSDVYPWRFNRGLSYARRPLVQVPGDDGTLVWGKRQVARSLRLLAQDLETARYKADSAEMRSAQGQVNDAAGKSFNWRVAACIGSWFPGSILIERFERRGSVRMPSQLGDIDVLWALPAQRLLVAVECKYLRPARTPVELASEMKSLVLGSSGSPSHVERHRRRVEWLRANAGAVLDELQLDTKRKWRTSGLMVTDVKPMSSFVADVGMTVLSLAQLARANESELRTLLRGK